MNTSQTIHTPLLATSTAALTCACCYYYFYLHHRRGRTATSTEDAAVAAVLAFWFDGDPAELFSTRWFVPPKTAAQVAIDTEVRERFGALLCRAERGELDHWRDSPRSLVALIVVLDQLSRHVHRADRARVDANDARALELATSLLENAWERALPAAQLVFALMPLRHQPSAQRLATVLAHVEPALARSEADTRLLARFRKQTQLRQSHLQDSIGGGGGSASGGGGTGGGGGGSGDGNDGGEDPFEILERPDLEASLDQSGVDTDPLTLSIATFLHEVGGMRWNGGGATPSKATYAEAAAKQPRRPQGNPSAKARAAVAAKAEEGASSSTNGGNQSKTGGGSGGGGGGSGGGGGVEPPRAMLVSLSGGVDSMVLTHVLLRLQKRAVVPYTVHAVHIDYSNRAESSAEAAYLQRWCDARGVQVEVRVVHEVSRGVTARDEYEKESRRIRFEAYELCMAASGAPAVFFGHHRGDVQENVVSNAMKGGGLLELSGMAAASVVNRVMIWRPMLPHPKADVYAYAHSYGGAPNHARSAPTSQSPSQRASPIHQARGAAVSCSHAFLFLSPPHTLPSSPTSLPGEQCPTSRTRRQSGRRAAGCAASCCRCSRRSTEMASQTISAASAASLTNAPGCLRGMPNLLGPLAAARRVASWQSSPCADE